MLFSGRFSLNSTFFDSPARISSMGHCNTSLSLVAFATWLFWVAFCFRRIRFFYCSSFLSGMNSMMSPTSQFNTVQIFSITSILTFSSLDSFDMVVVLKPVCRRKPFLSYLYRSTFSKVFYSTLPYCHLLPLSISSSVFHFFYHTIGMRTVQSIQHFFVSMLYKLAF